MDRSWRVVQLVGQNPPYTYRKDGVFYFARRVQRHDGTLRRDEDRHVTSSKTGSLLRDPLHQSHHASMSIDVVGIDYLNIPSHRKEQAASSPHSTLQSFENYHALKGRQDALDHHHVLLIMPSKHLEKVVNTPQLRKLRDDLMTCHQAVLNASLHPSGLLPLSIKEYAFGVQQRICKHLYSGQI